MFSEDITNYSLNHPEFLELMEDVADKINAVAERGANESTISTTFDKEIGIALGKIHLEYNPEREVTVQGLYHGQRGRIDSRINHVIVEFKQKSTFSTRSDQQNAIDQVVAYAKNLVNSGVASIYAYATDGISICEIIVTSSEYIRSPIVQLDGKFLVKFAKSVMGTTRKALSASNLVETFAEKDSPIRRIAKGLYYAIGSTASESRETKLFEEWKKLFNLAHDDISKQKAMEERRLSLEDAIGCPLSATDVEEQYKALFALQTAYSILLKCTAVNVLNGIGGYTEESLDFSRVKILDGDSLKIFLEQIESGLEYRMNGVDNLLEGDYFSWYVLSDHSVARIHDAVIDLLVEIAKFESLPEFHGQLESAQDLFKELYMRIIPQKVRHSLGEYYTPSWLADDAINQAIDSLSEGDRDSWRLLDPTCGSGTFLTMGMSKVIKSTESLEDHDRLDQILTRVVGVDLNPLAVLTARINYFINISPLIRRGSDFHIPVYLGDASVTPEVREISGIDCVTYSFETSRGSVSAEFPVDSLGNLAEFSTLMADVEMLASEGDTIETSSLLIDFASRSQINQNIEKSLTKLANSLVDLEMEGWKGFWPRVIGDFISTGALGKFDVIVGNPPWIDWKNLPAGYRSRLTDLCIEREIFSGDGVTGGINLNICALICLTAADNWLNDSGVVSFLMPESLIYQQSYEGFRRLKIGVSGRRLILQSASDWSSAGYPFDPVRERFLNYVFSASGEHCTGQSGPVPVRKVIKKRGKELPDASSNRMMDSSVLDKFDFNVYWLAQLQEGKTYYTRLDSVEDEPLFRRISGVSPYLGREGIEFYPQELLLFEYVCDSEEDGLAYFKNAQMPKSKYRIAPRTYLLETSMMRPVVRGPSITAFNVRVPEYFTPFVYSPEFEDGRSPLPLSELRKKAPKISRYFFSYRGVFESQTAYNGRIIGTKHNTEFYALARVGKYSHAPYKVCFRDNSKWAVAVASEIEVPWGGSSAPVFQNHAVSISERPDGSFIDEEEAFYISGVLNADPVRRFVLNSSEKRSFKIRVPVGLPLFDKEDNRHCRIASLARSIHRLGAEESEELVVDLNQQVLDLF